MYLKLLYAIQIKQDNDIRLFLWKCNIPVYWISYKLNKIVLKLFLLNNEIKGTSNSRIKWAIVPQNFIQCNIVVIKIHLILLLETVILIKQLFRSQVENDFHSHDSTPAIFVQIAIFEFCG